MSVPRFAAAASLALCALAASPAFAATAPPAPLAPELTARIDALFTDWDRPDTPGCVLGVAKDGALVYQRGYGMASLDRRARNTPETVFPIGSISKQFTAMLVALLAEEGKLGLDDDIRKHLPEMPAYERPITVRHLVHHTSGLRDYQALRFLAGFAPSDLELARVLALVARQKGLQFPPGERFEYSNTNYVLLRVIAERAAGKPIRDLAAERLFAPLGMTRSELSEDFERVIPQRATPYTGDLATGFRGAHVPPLAGSGGVWTTLADLLRWDENFYANRLGRARPELVAQAVTPVAVADGTPGTYGFGIFLDEHRGRPIQWHAGRGPGYVADVVRFPAEHLSVFCLCNGTIDSRLLSRTVADLVLGEQPTPLRVAGPTPARTPLRLPPATLRALAGDYQNPATGTVWNVRAEESGLVVHAAGTRLELAASGPAEFWTARPALDWRIVFEDRPAGGKIVRLFEEGGETARYEPLGGGPGPAELAAFAGRYLDDELDNPYELVVEGGALHLRTKIQPAGELLAAGPDRFVLPTEWFVLTFQFERDPGGRVTGFRLDSGGADGFRFRKAS